MMILFWKTLLGSLSLICFVSFAWAIKKHFRTVGEDGNMPFRMRVISILGLVFMIFQLSAVVTADTFRSWAAISSAITYLISFVLFWSAIAATRQQRLTLAFSTDAPQHLLTSGPYKMVRHPFYTAYILFWLAGTVAFWQLWLLPSAAIMTALYVQAARAEENKFCNSSLQNAHNLYKKHTGMFFPKLFS